jgi:hypothetical protein
MDSRSVKGRFLQFALAGVGGGASGLGLAQKQRVVYSGTVCNPPGKWVAERLAMGSWSNDSNQLAVARKVAQ